MKTLFSAIHYFLHNSHRSTDDPDYLRVSGETYWIYQIYVAAAGYVFWGGVALGSAIFVPDARPMFSAITAILLLSGPMHLRHLVTCLREQRQFDGQFYG